MLPVVSRVVERVGDQSQTLGVAAQSLQCSRFRLHGSPVQTYGFSLSAANRMTSVLRIAARNTIPGVSLMSQNIDRRGFLKAAPAASAAAYSCLFARLDGQTSKPAGVRIGTESYAPVGDYPIRPKRGAGVRIKDRFWGPKIRTNAEVTIPFEAQKFEQADREF